MQPRDERGEMKTLMIKHDDSSHILFKGVRVAKEVPEFPICL